MSCAATASMRPGEVRLKLDRLSLDPDGPFAVELKDISLDVRAGEVVAIAGVAGNGQSEFFDAVSGERIAARATAMLQIDGKAMGRAGVNARRKAGAAFVPEERLGHGAVPGFTPVGERDSHPPCLGQVAGPLGPGAARTMPRASATA